MTYSPPAQLQHQSISPVECSNPVIVEFQTAVEFDCRHVAFDASGLRRDRASDVGFVVTFMASNALVFVIGDTHLGDRRVRAVARCATKSTFGLQVALASQQPDRLESDKDIRILANFFFGNAAR